LPNISSVLSRKWVTLSILEESVSIGARLGEASKVDH